MTSVDVSRRCSINALTDGLGPVREYRVRTLATGGFQSGGLMARAVDGNTLYRPGSSSRPLKPWC
jgi:hypothetical protein